MTPTRMQIERVWRVGRKVGRTIYAQLGAEPSDDDQLIGVMDTPELAEAVVRAHEAATGEFRTTAATPIELGDLRVAAREVLGVAPAGSVRYAKALAHLRAALGAGP